jgi:hypothetical protein
MSEGEQQVPWEEDICDLKLSKIFHTKKHIQGLGI